MTNDNATIKEYTAEQRTLHGCSCPCSECDTPMLLCRRILNILERKEETE